MPLGHSVGIRGPFQAPIFLSYDRPTKYSHIAWGSPPQQVHGKSQIQIVPSLTNSNKNVQSDQYYYLRDVT